MPMEKRSKKLSVAWAVMLILWEIKATITFKMIRLVTTPRASLAAPLLVEILASTFFIIEFSVIIKNSTNLQPCGVLPPLLFSPICFKKSKDAVLLHL
jgi:hypothetical protein